MSFEESKRMSEIFIQITDAALAHLKKIVQKERAIGFRLSLKKAGCNGYMYVPDVIKEINQNDIKINIHDLHVFIDREQVEKMKGTIVDLVSKGLGQEQIIFKNPHAKGECGCGESFNLE